MNKCLKCEREAEKTVLSPLGIFYHYCDKHYKEYEIVQDEVRKIYEQSFYEDDFHDYED